MGKPRSSLKPQKMSNEFFKIISETNNYARQQLIESVLPHSPWACQWFTKRISAAAERLSVEKWGEQSLLLAYNIDH